MSSAIASPILGEENDFYVVENHIEIKKIQVSTRTIVASYRPLDDVLLPAEIALYRNWELRSIDFYFEDTTRLLATYECFLIADDTRRVVLIVYNMLNPLVGIRYIIALPHPFRVGGAKTVR